MPKQKTSTLFHFWHNLQDIKDEAEQLKDGELVLLVGMMELLVEEPGPYTVVALSPTDLGSDGRLIYTVTQGPAIFDGGRLSFSGRLTRNHVSNGDGS